MRSNPRVDLHCHSTFSDGALEPEELVDRLSAAGVAFAALTDHDTLDGLDRFRAAAARRGVAAITGTELTTLFRGREAHLLGYNFIIDDALKAEFETLRLKRIGALDQNKSLHSIEACIRQSDPAINGCARNPSIEQGIHLIQKAGGKAFLAHPLLFEPDREKLREILVELKEAGLDGIEAIYGKFTPDQRQWLCSIADELGLLVSAGMDQHSDRPDAEFGMVMPKARWTAFRQSVLADARFSQSPPPWPRSRRFQKRQFVLHFIVPTLLAIGLFIVAIFGVFLPTFERSLMERKREMIRELTNSAWSILNEAHHQEMDGGITREQAMDIAKSRISVMRYGREGKDYFWLQDMHPRMIMHPYRQDLDDKDLTDFRDPRGVAIFVEFADLVKRRDDGYVEYVWQWKDDPTHLAPKESYIRSFAPWGWIIGTGIYLDDVREEIARLERGLAVGSASISAMVILLLAYVMRESLRLERKRSDAERDLHDSRERYRCLIEAASEGALLILQDRCRYANPVLLEMLGVSPGELELLDLEDILGTRDENAEAWSAISQAGTSDKPAADVPARIRKRNGELLACRISVRPLEFAGRMGLIILVRPDSVLSRQQTRVPMIDGLAQIPPDVAGDLAGKVAAAGGPEDVASLCRQTPQLVRSLLDCGAHPRHITRLISSVCDAATVRLIQLAQDSLGPAPAPFAFIALGSQGRSEQTLCTDQDNAIIIADNPPPDADAWFQELGRQVCSNLAQAGYLLCSGGIMASNAKWRMPLEAWKKSFTHWIVKSEPRELLQLSIFFDFRCVFGDESLVSRLRSHVRSASATPDFPPRFAQHSLEFKPPRWIFGRLVGAETPGMLDLKTTLMPIVSFARLYSLKHGLAETGTLDRLGALATLGQIPESTRDQIQQAYESLMRLRLGRQVESIFAGQPADNLISPGNIGHIEMAVIKASFAEIEACQQRVVYDFLGGKPL